MEAPDSLKHNEDMERKLLEMRVAHLEEIRRSRAQYFGDCCPCATLICGCMWKLISSIPYINIFALSLPIVGAYLCWEHQEPLIDFTQRLKFTQEAKHFVSSTPLVLSLALFVDAFSVVAAIPMTGPLRTICFGGPARGCIGFMQALAGPLTLAIVMILLFVLFILFFIGVLFAMPGVLVVSLTWASCKLGDESVTNGLADSFGHVPRADPSILDAYTKFAMQSITTTCQEDYHVLYASFRYYALGLVLLALGQAWQAMMTMNSFSKVMMTIDTSRAWDDEGGRDVDAS